MSLNGIQALQQTRMEGSLDKRDAAEDGQEDAIATTKANIQKTYDKRMAKIEEDRKAREKERLGTLFGTIFLGPLIGTLIGKAIGNGLADGNKDNALELQKEGDIGALMTEKSTDRMMESQEDYQQAMEATEEVSRFSDELRDHRSEDAMS